MPRSAGLSGTPDAAREAFLGALWAELVARPTATATEILEAVAGLRARRRRVA